MSEPANHTILYIEDDRSSRNLVRRMLKYAGYEVWVAANGLEGIDLARKHRPDLILMDISLPDLSGREVTTRLRALGDFEDVPIVALTARDYSGEREKALAAGLNGYLTKPVDIISLPQQVEAYLNGHKETLPPAELAEAQAAYSQEVVERLVGKIHEVQVAYQDLSRLDKMKDAFIQLTAHELRTPMTLIVGYGRLLEQHPLVTSLMAQDEELHSLIGHLQSAIKRMSGVINEVLMVGRVTSGYTDLALNLCDINELIQEVAAEYMPHINQRGLELHLNAQNKPVMVYGDADLLRLAMSNLLSNAIKYTPDGGQITIHTTLQDHHLLLAVEDTGIGIDEAEQPLIFESFYTGGDTHLHSTSKVAFRGGGLGLGLSICRGVAEAHQGRLWVESPGRDASSCPGSTFYMTVPVRSGGAELPGDDDSLLL